MRLRKFLYHMLAAIALVQASAVAANETVTDKLRVCAAISNAIERLVCFDEVVESLEPRNQPVNRDALTRPSVTAPPEPERRGRGVEARQQGMDIELNSETQAQIVAAEQRAIDAERQLRELRQQEAKAAAAAQDEKWRQPPTEKTYYEIIEVWQSPRGLQRFRLENGSSWEQISSGDRLVVREGETYFIQPGRFGGFSLGSNRNNRRMRVQPLD